MHIFLHSQYIVVFGVWTKHFELPLPQPYEAHAGDHKQGFANLLLGALGKPARPSTPSFNTYDNAMLQCLGKSTGGCTQEQTMTARDESPVVRMRSHITTNDERRGENRDR